jgi:hypothetical protein
VRVCVVWCGVVWCDLMCVWLSEFDGVCVHVYMCVCGEM